LPKFAKWLHDTGQIRIVEVNSIENSYVSSLLMTAEICSFMNFFLKDFGWFARIGVLLNTCMFAGLFVQPEGPQVLISILVWTLVFFFSSFGYDEWILRPERRETERRVGEYFRAYQDSHFRALKTQRFLRNVCLFRYFRAQARAQHAAPYCDLDFRSIQIAL
jgi:hypothetical protein